MVVYASDVLLLRVLRLFPSLAQDRLRRIVLRDGTNLVYRGNRGDIRSIGEIWVQEVYKLPVAEPTVRSLVDMGANIGLASVWFARRYGCEAIVAVEPDPDNARIAAMNFARNHVNGKVINAAVGPRDGTARFARSPDSMLGTIDDEGEIEVAVLSPATILSLLDADGLDVLKLDIEGGEVALAHGDLAWLDDVRLIVGELHPMTSDAEAVVRALASRGFALLPAGAVFPDGQSAFYRPGVEVPLLKDG
jgi:FkbM family methyltransferase